MFAFRAAPSQHINPNCFRDDGHPGAMRLSDEGLNCELNVNLSLSRCSNITRRFRCDLLTGGVFGFKYMAAGVGMC